MTAAILFDFNGVIVDDEPQHCEALIATLGRVRLRARPRHLLPRVSRLRRPRVLPLHLRPHGPAGATSPRCSRPSSGRTPTTSAPSARRCGWCPAPTDFIESAALDGFQLAIVSGALRREIELVLELAGLRPHFAEIVAAEDVSACKPDPAGVQPGPRGAGRSRRSRCMVIEDSLPGLAAARAAGLRCAMLATSHGEDACADADLVWRDFIGHDARRAALGPCLSSTSGSIARGSTGSATAPSWSPPSPRCSGCSGPGALTCLQGLLTNDLEKPGDGSLVYGALLTPKGMIVVDAWVLRQARRVHPDHARRSGHAAALELFTRAAPAPARPGDRSHRRRPRVAWLLGAHGFQVLAKSGVGDAGVGRPGGLGRRRAEPGGGGAGARVGAVRGAGGGARAGGRAAGRAAGRGRRARPATSATCTPPGMLCGWPALGVEIDERTLPQEVRYDEIGGVSYTKGCYTGQETVARLHFRGHTNRELRGLRWTATPEPLDGPRPSLGEKEVGSVRSTLTLEDRSWAGAASGARSTPGERWWPAAGGPRWWRCRSARTSWTGDQRQRAPSNARGPLRQQDRQLTSWWCPGPSSSRTTSHRAVVRHPPMPVSAARQAPSRRYRRPARGLLLATAGQHEHRGHHRVFFIVAPDTLGFGQLRLGHDALTVAAAGGTAPNLSRAPFCQAEPR